MSKIKQLLWAAPAVITFHDLVGTVIRVKGPSMQPTLNPIDSDWDDWIVVDKFSIRILRHYQPGSVVVLR
jgi:signal peptidase I